MRVASALFCASVCMLVDVFILNAVYFVCVSITVSHVFGLWNYLIYIYIYVVKRRPLNKKIGSFQLPASSFQFPASPASHFQLLTFSCKLPALTSRLEVGAGS
jgi:hypothetical protein